LALLIGAEATPLSNMKQRKFCILGRTDGSELFVTTSYDHCLSAAAAARGKIVCKTSEPSAVSPHISAGNGENKKRNEKRVSFYASMTMRITFCTHFRHQEPME
jgi:hypothetical protein